jgi:NADH-quinone oxidoreductase subunit M
LLFYLLVEVLTQKAEVNLLGFRHTSPAISILLCIAALALAGMPGTSGFITLYYIVFGLYKAYPILFAFSLLGWVMTAIYVIKPIIVPILKQKKGQNDKRLDNRRNIDYVPLFIIVFFIICIGVYPVILSEQIVQTIELLIIQEQE